MADLLNTNLVIVAAPLLADFWDTPQALFEAMIERMSIKSPVGQSFFISGDIEPQSNQGPWLKGGRQWYVYSSTDGGYIPLDISDSTARLFTVSDTEPDEPSDDDATVWLRTAAGRVIGWYFWTGDEWRPGGNVPPSGPTASRPSSPTNFEQYFDTDINALIHWERGAWRTVSGVPGDIKFVKTPTLTVALETNPGWEYLGDSDQAVIGRTLGVAAKDPGASPESSFATPSGTTQRSAGEDVGTETHVLTSTEIEQHTHLVGALTALSSDNNAQFYRVDNADTFVAPVPRPPNYAQINGDNTADGTKIGELPTPSAGTMFVTSRQLSLTTAAGYTAAAEAHNNIQPTRYYWALTKS